MGPKKVVFLQTMDSPNFPLHFVSDLVNSSCGSGRLVYFALADGVDQNLKSCLSMTWINGDYLAKASDVIVSHYPLHFVIDKKQLWVRETTYALH